MGRPKTRIWINVVLCLIAMGVMAFYFLCTSACSYFKGSIFGLDLKTTGVVYMAALIVLTLLRQELLTSLCLGVGLGSELILVAFQVRQGRYCPFCLTYGAILAVLFLVNFRWSSRRLILAAVVLGFLVFLFFFKGSFVPRFQVDLPF